MSLEPLITVDHTKCYCPSSTEEEYSLKVTTTRYLRRKYQRRFAPYKTAQKFISFPPEMWDPASSHGYPTFNATNDSVFRPSPTMIHQHCSDNIPPYVTAQVSDRMVQPSVPQPGYSDMLNTFSSSPKRLEKSLVTEVKSSRGNLFFIFRFCSFYFFYVLFCLFFHWINNCWNDIIFHIWKSF